MGLIRFKDTLKEDKQVLFEKIGPIEAESNRRHMASVDKAHAGPDPKVQRELRHQALLQRVANAYSRKKKTK